MRCSAAVIRRADDSTEREPPHPEELKPNPTPTEAITLVSRGQPACTEMIKIARLTELMITAVINTLAWPI